MPGLGRALGGGVVFRWLVRVGFAAGHRPTRRRSRNAGLQIHVDGASRSSKDHRIVVGIGLALHTAAPGVDGILETPHHRKAHRRDARGQPIHLRPGGLRSRAQGDALRPHRLRAGHQLGHAVEHRPGRPQAQRRQNREPAQGAEHMPVRRQHRVRDQAAQDLLAWPFGHLHLLPLRQQQPRPRIVATLERVANLGEVVAELPKAQRDIQNRRAPQHRRRPAQRRMQRQIHQQGQQRRQAGRHRPGQPAVVALAGIEIARHPAHPGPRCRMHRVVGRKRPHLLDQQRKQNGEETHAPIISAMHGLAARAEGARPGERFRCRYRQACRNR